MMHLTACGGGSGSNDSSDIPNTGDMDNPTVESKMDPNTGVSPIDIRNIIGVSSTKTVVLEINEEEVNIVQRFILKTKDSKIDGNETTPSISTKEESTNQSLTVKFNQKSFEIPFEQIIQEIKNNKNGAVLSQNTILYDFKTKMTLKDFFTILEQQDDNLFINSYFLGSNSENKLVASENINIKQGKLDILASFASTAPKINFSVDCTKNIGCNITNHTNTSSKLPIYIWTIKNQDKVLGTFEGYNPNIPLFELFKNLKNKSGTITLKVDDGRNSIEPVSLAFDFSKNYQASTKPQIDQYVIKFELNDNNEPKLINYIAVDRTNREDSNSQTEIKYAPIGNVYFDNISKHDTNVDYCNDAEHSCVTEAPQELKFTAQEFKDALSKNATLYVTAKGEENRVGRKYYSECIDTSSDWQIEGGTATLTVTPSQLGDIISAYAKVNHVSCADAKLRTAAALGIKTTELNYDNKAVQWYMSILDSGFWQFETGNTADVNGDIILNMDSIKNMFEVIWAQIPSSEMHWGAIYHIQKAIENNIPFAKIANYVSSHQGFSGAEDEYMYDTDDKYSWDNEVLSISPNMSFCKSDGCLFYINVNKPDETKSPIKATLTLCPSVATNNNFKDCSEKEPGYVNFSGNESDNGIATIGYATTAWLSYTDKFYSGYQSINNGGKVYLNLYKENGITHEWEALSNYTPQEINVPLPNVNNYKLYRPNTYAWFANVSGDTVQIEHNLITIFCSSISQALLNECTDDETIEANNSLDYVAFYVKDNWTQTQQLRFYAQKFDGYDGDYDRWYLNNQNTWVARINPNALDSIVAAYDFKHGLGKETPQIWAEVAKKLGVTEDELYFEN